MGFHTCEYCIKNDAHVPATSSGDVTLTFASGRSYIVPDMITHYVEEHGYQPPHDFMRDVLYSELLASGRVQTKGVPIRVGYLQGEFTTNQHLDPAFALRLRQVLEAASRQGGRMQTRGM